MFIIRYLYTKSLVIPTGLLVYDKVFIYLCAKIFENMANVVRNSEFSNDSLNFQTSAYESGLNFALKYEGEDIFFNDNAGVVYINATQMGKKFGKRPVDWLKSQQAKEYIKAYSEVLSVTSADLVRIRKGGNDKDLQGTWLYRDIDLEFARWLDPKFSIWCNNVVKELALRGRVELSRVQYSPVSTDELNIRRIEANNRSAEILERVLSRTSIPEFRQVIDHYIVEMVTGNSDALPLPACTERTYTATQIGEMLGVSANRIGKIANTWNLKVPENGKWFYDKSKFSNKEVETFRYNERGLNLLREIIGKEGYADKHRKDREGDIPSCNTLFGD